MKKDLKYWLVAIVLCIWQFPQLLVSLIMLPFLGKKTKIADRHHNICYGCSNMMGGISLGPLSFVSEYMATLDPYVRHEVDGHTWDSKVMGPLYLVIVGLPSLLNAVFDFTKCYYDFYTEKWANKHAKINVDGYCRLKIK